MTTWLEHVKQVHASGSTSFKESLKRASASWKKGKGKSDSAAAPKKKRGRKKKRAAEEKTSTPEPEAPIKKKRRRKAKKSMPKIPAAVFSNVDSRNL